MDRVMKLTRSQCRFTMISALFVVVCTCIGITMNLTTLYDENFDHMGLPTFCMFTVNSNILDAVAMMMILPYTLDGLRKHNYHLPKWLVVFVFSGVTAVSLTFVISLCVLAPVKGFVPIFTGSRFFLHFICPVLAILAFCFCMSEQRITFTDSLFALIPVTIYSTLYYIMVEVIGEENGGWNDFYGFLTLLPHWIPISLILPVTLGIATVIRLLHNRTYRIRQEQEAAFFKATFGQADIRKIVAAMARSHSTTAKPAKEDDIHIPKRVISILLENNEGDCTLQELCEIYLKEYMENCDVLKMEKMWI